MCIGGSSAKTDRTSQLYGQGKERDIGNYLQALGQRLTGQGIADTKTGLGEVGKAAKYYSDILSGDPSKVLASVSPSVSAITGETDQAKTAIARGGNRAGGSNAQALQLNEKARAAILDTINKAKPGAAAGLERTGASTAGIGTTESGQGISATSDAASTFSNLVSQSISSRGQSYQINQDQQQQWADIVAGLIFGL